MLGVLGATFDNKVHKRANILITNIGNFHTLAFRINDGKIEGVFEHHTGLLKLNDLETLLIQLADSTLTHEDVFDHHGHGALIYDLNPYPMDAGEFNLAVTGPRRNIMANRRESDSRLRPYYAVPFGDMMIAGCFGLLAAVADKIPSLQEPIQKSLSQHGNSDTAPWDI